MLEGRRRRMKREEAGFRLGKSREEREDAERLGEECRDQGERERRDGRGEEDGEFDGVEFGECGRRARGLEGVVIVDGVGWKAVRRERRDDDELDESILLVWVMLF